MDSTHPSVHPPLATIDPRHHANIHPTRLYFTSLPVCITTARSAATSVPVTVVLVSLMDMDLLHYMEQTKQEAVSGPTWDLWPLLQSIINIQLLAHQEQGQQFTLIIETTGGQQLSVGHSSMTFDLFSRSTANNKQKQQDGDNIIHRRATNAFIRF
jgi:hypothetical protein